MPLVSIGPSASVLSVSSSSESQLKLASHPHRGAPSENLSVSSSSESQLKLIDLGHHHGYIFATFSLFFIRESIETQRAQIPLDGERTAFSLFFIRESIETMETSRLNVPYNYTFSLFFIRESIETEDMRDVTMVFY